MAVTRAPSGQSGAVQDRTVGRVLGGRYRVLSRLGEGGMGTVYLCEHAVLGRRYAVKVLRPDLAGDAELAERFRNEAIAASRIGGENVVDVLDFDAEADGAIYYVMEALEGRSLGAVIGEDGPLDVSRALALLAQLCRALGAAHARGVVHRDVKPDNVFVVRGEDGAERVKVIDFGISQVSPELGRGGRLTRAGAVIGTPEYMAPEQAAGDEVDHRADVYALGVLAYELLTGTLPIVATTPIATLVAHQTRTPEAPGRRRPGIPPEVDALVMSMLAKRPGDRPASMDVLGARIAALRGAADEPRPASPAAPSRPTGALPDASRTSGRRGALRAVALALGVGVLAGAAGLAARLRTPPRAVPSASPSTPATAAAIPAPTRAAGAGPERRAVPSPSSDGARSKRAPRPAPDPHHEDPYAAGALKPDPFR
jgi:serine/threonine-protein kinase